MADGFPALWRRLALMEMHPLRVKDVDFKKSTGKLPCATAGPKGFDHNGCPSRPFDLLKHQL